MRKILLSLIILLGAVSVHAATNITKHDYLEAITRAESVLWDRYQSSVDEWHAERNDTDRPVPNIYWSYMAALLYHTSGDTKYAERARDVLLNNPRYENYVVVRTLQLIKGSAVLTRSDLTVIEERIVQAAGRAVEYWVEWGAMNHATNHIVNSLAATLLYLPDHEDADVWRRKLDINVSASWGRWSIEDSQNYLAPWMLPMMQYAELAGRENAFYAEPLTRYYCDYAVQLMTPDGQIAKFGDGGDGGDYTWYMIVPMLEKAAAVYKDGRMKWAARKIFESNVHGNGMASFFAMPHLVDAWFWADDTVEETIPDDPSRLVLEDYVGKKIVFRNGWDPDATYLFLNYLDDAPFGIDGKEHMINTINVETEKNHHGQADENAICLFMKGGDVLLHDSGYRETWSTGPDGQFRADVFHNRMIVRPGMADPQKRLLPFLLDGGQYHFVNTKLMHFKSYEHVDMSRSRVTDPDMGYQWDRCISYLKDRQWFVVYDIIKVLRDGPLTFAQLYYTQDILDYGPDWYDTRYRTIGTSWQSGGFAGKNSSMLFNPSNEIHRNRGETQLIVWRPEADGFRSGVEPVRRCYQTELALYTAQTDTFRSGDILVFNSVLIPHDKETAPSEIMPKIEIFSGDRGYGMKIMEKDGYTQINVMLDLEAEYLRENIRPRYNFESGRADYGSLVTDARYCYLRRRGERLYYAFFKASRLDYENRSLFQAKGLMHGQDNGVYRIPGISKWVAWEDEIQLKGR